VLKNIITAPRTERGTVISTDIISEEPAIPVKPVLSTEPVISEVPVSAEPVIVTTDGMSSDELNHEIMEDLNRLQELKHDFEVSVEAFQHSKYTKPSAKPKQEKTPAKEAVQKKKDEALDLIPEPSGEGILEEIKTTKKKITPENLKQKEQIEIIEQFIKKQPSIAKNNASNAADPSDLAERNLSLTDNIVSETLVEILLRQGKKDKAIEVLKKLIWKFPQKKAIFAAQIDELKK
jgi:hypothetical protein